MCQIAENVIMIINSPLFYSFQKKRISKIGNVLGKKNRTIFYNAFRLMIFRWSDNTLVDYSKWGSSNPANDQQKQCADLERASVWASVHCWNLLPSVCEKPAPKENIKRSIV